MERRSKASIDSVLKLDPAKITDQIERYTGTQFDGFEIRGAKRGRKRVAVIEIGAAGNAPLAFTKPGTYVPAEREQADDRLLQGDRVFPARGEERAWYNG